LGFVGAFEWDGRFIGTIRFVPLGMGLAPCEAVVARHPELPPGILQNAWEVGRLVLDPAFRAQADLLKTCIYLTFMRFIEETPEANVLATCNPLLGRLYRRFGLSVIVKDACQLDGEMYSLIHGNEASVSAALCHAAGARQ
jgi:hypothetical protein